MDREQCRKEVRDVCDNLHKEIWTFGLQLSGWIFCIIMAIITLITGKFLLTVGFVLVWIMWTVSLKKSLTELAAIPGCNRDGRPRFLSGGDSTSGGGFA